MSLTKFVFENELISVIRDGNDIWFKGKSVALALGYKNPANAIEKHVDIDCKKKVHVSERSPLWGPYIFIPNSVYK